VAYTPGWAPSGYIVGLNTARNPLLAAAVSETRQDFNAPVYSYSLTPSGVVHTQFSRQDSLGVDLGIVALDYDWPGFEAGFSSEYRGFANLNLNQDAVVWESPRYPRRIYDFTTQTETTAFVNLHNTWTDRGIVSGASGLNSTAESFATVAEADLRMLVYDRANNWDSVGIEDPVRVKLFAPPPELIEDIFVTQPSETNHYGRFFGNNSRIRSNVLSRPNPFTINYTWTPARNYLP